MNEEFNYMKKGVQYSHYCGGDLIEIICAIDNAMFEKNTDDLLKWCKYAKNRTELLTNKIAHLDIINNMNL